MSDNIAKSIQEQNAARKLNILKGFVEVEELSKAGHMDFAGGAGKSKLVEKQITDKRGHQTKRWVKPGEDEKEGSTSGQADLPAEGGVKDVTDYATETSTEELRKFIQTADDSQIDLIEAAEEELRNRGEETGLDPMEEEGTEEKFDWNDSESVKAYLAENPDVKARWLAEIEEDIFVDPARLLRTLAKEQKGSSDHHAKIDAAQAALDDLKASSGHPDAQEEHPDPNYNQMEDEDDVEAANKLFVELDGTEEGMKHKEVLDKFLNQEITAGEFLNHFEENGYEWDDQEEEEADSEETSRQQNPNYDKAVAKHKNDRDSAEGGDKQDDYEPYNSKGQDKPNKADKKKPDGSKVDVPYEKESNETEDSYSTVESAIKGIEKWKGDAYQDGDQFDEGLQYYKKAETEEEKEAGLEEMEYWKGDAYQEGDEVDLALKKMRSELGKQ